MADQHSEIEMNPYKIKGGLKKLFAFHNPFFKNRDMVIRKVFFYPEKDSEFKTSTVAEIRMPKRQKNIVFWIYQLLMLGIVIATIVIFKINYDELSMNYLNVIEKFHLSSIKPNIIWRKNKRFD